jgi:hypothetical protein
MSEPSPLLEFIMQALASKPEERGCLFYAVLTFTVGIAIAAVWPFGGTPADVLTGYGIVVDRPRCGDRQRRVAGEVVLSQHQLSSTGTAALSHIRKPLHQSASTSAFSSPSATSGGATSMSCTCQ